VKNKKAVCGDHVGQKYERLDRLSKFPEILDSYLWKSSSESDISENCRRICK